MDRSSESLLPLAQLQPSIDPTAHYIRGIVTLIWPYSASKQISSFLLVEPDFRLRRQKGQVRVVFRGASAKAVARSEIKSGDEVFLKLSGAKWAEDEAAIRTPGRSIGWEIRFGQKLELQIQRENASPVILQVDRSSPSPVIEPLSPPPSTILDLEPPITRNDYTSLQKPDVWSSPAFLKRKRLPSTSIFDTALDPFLLDDDVESERYISKKTKFGRKSGEWRYADRSPSPEKEIEVHVPDQLAVANGVTTGSPGVEATANIPTFAEAAVDLDLGVTTASAVDVHGPEEEEMQATAEVIPADDEDPFQTQVEYPHLQATGDSQEEAPEISDGSETSFISQANKIPTPEPLLQDDDESQEADDNLSSGSEASFTSQTNRLPATTAPIASSLVEIFETVPEILSDAESEAHSQAGTLHSYMEVGSSDKLEEVGEEPEWKLPEGWVLPEESPPDEGAEPIVTYPDLTQQGLSETLDEKHAAPIDANDPPDETNSKVESFQAVNNPLALEENQLQRSSTSHIKVVTSAVSVVKNGHSPIDLDDEIEEIYEGDVEHEEEIEDEEYDSDPNFGLETGPHAMPDEDKDLLDEEDEYSSEHSTSQKPGYSTSGVRESPVVNLPVSQNKDDPIIILSDSSSAGSEDEADYTRDDGSKGALEDEFSEEFDYEAEEGDVPMEDYPEQLLQEEDSMDDDSESVPDSALRNQSYIYPNQAIRTTQGLDELRYPYSAQAKRTAQGAGEDYSEDEEEDYSASEEDDGDSEQDLVIDDQPKEMIEESEDSIRQDEELIPQHLNSKDYKAAEEEYDNIGEAVTSAKGIMIDDRPKGPLEANEDSPIETNHDIVLEDQEQPLEEDKVSNDQPSQLLSTPFHAQTVVLSQPKLASDTVELVELSEHSEVEDKFPNDQTSGFLTTTPPHVQSAVHSHPEPIVAAVEIIEQSQQIKEEEEILEAPEHVTDTLEKAEAVQSTQIIDLEEDDDGDNAATSRDDSAEDKSGSEKHQDEDSEAGKSVVPSQSQNASQVQNIDDMDIDTQFPENQTISMPSCEILNLSTQLMDFDDHDGPSTEVSTGQKEKLSVPFTPEPSGLQAQFDVEIEDAPPSPEPIQEAPPEEIKQEQLVTPVNTQLVQEPIRPEELSEDDEESDEVEEIEENTGAAQTQEPIRPSDSSEDYAESEEEAELQDTVEHQAQNIDQESVGSPSRQLWNEIEQSRLEDQNDSDESFESSPAPSEYSLHSPDVDRIEADAEELMPSSPGLEVKPALDFPSGKVKLPAPDPAVKVDVQPKPPSKGLRTTLAYFAPLSAISEYFNSTVDVYAVVVDSTAPIKLKSGRKDFHETLFLADFSSTTSSSSGPIVLAEVYRPYKRALPIAQPGDTILLRNFRVQYQRDNFGLISADTSAWAVVRTGEDAQIRGPPMELGEEERDFAEGLSEWWLELDVTKREAVQSIANELKKPPPKKPGLKKEANSSQQAETDVTLNYDDPVDSPPEITRHRLRDGTTYADRNSQSQTPSKKTITKAALEVTSEDELAEPSRHILRDGRSYADSPPMKQTRKKVATKQHQTEVDGLLEDSHIEDSVVVGKHELRDGTTYADEAPRDTVGVHRLRNGTAYRDRG